MAKGKAYGMDSPSLMADEDVKARSRIMFDDMNNGDPNRPSKLEANYADSGKGDHTCGTCLFYAPETDTLGRCIKVAGVILSSGHSDYYTSLSGVVEKPHKASTTHGGDD